MERKGYSEEKIISMLEAGRRYLQSYSSGMEHRAAEIGRLKEKFLNEPPPTPNG